MAYLMQRVTNYSGAWKSGAYLDRPDQSAYDAGYANAFNEVLDITYEDITDV